MIFLFTDFGVTGPYVGQMKAVLATRAPEARIIDLMHDAPPLDPKFSAYLLAALAAEIPAGVTVLAVVDPGVGDRARRPVIMRTGTHSFVGPDNGLFSIAARRVGTATWSEIDWRPERLSTSFHGRDLFAPVAASLARGTPVESHDIDGDGVVGADWPDDLGEVIYIDHYGNAMTGIRAETLPANAVLKTRDRTIAEAETFSSVPKGEAMWYRNSIGLVEIAANMAHADAQFGIGVGTHVLAVPSD